MKPETSVKEERETGAHLRIRHRHIDKDTLHDNEDTRTVDDDPHCRRNPVDAPIRRPSEEKQAHGRAEASEQRRQEAVFLRTHPVPRHVRVEMPADVRAVDDDGEQDRNQHAQERHADHARAEAVEGRVDKREDLEEGVVDAVGERGVDVDEGDGGVFERDLEGLDHGVEDDGRRFEVALLDLALAAEVDVAGEFAEALRAPEEDVGR